MNIKIKVKFNRDLESGCSDSNPIRVPTKNGKNPQTKKNPQACIQCIQILLKSFLSFIVNRDAEPGGCYPDLSFEKENPDINTTFEKNTDPTVKKNLIRILTRFDLAKFTFCSFQST